MWQGCRVLILEGISMESATIDDSRTAAWCTAMFIQKRITRSRCLPTSKMCLICGAQCGSRSLGRAAAAHARRRCLTRSGQLCRRGAPVTLCQASQILGPVRRLSRRPRQHVTVLCAASSVMRRRTSSPHTRRTERLSRMSWSPPLATWRKSGRARRRIDRVTPRGCLSSI